MTPRNRGKKRKRKSRPAAGKCGGTSSVRGVYSSAWKPIDATQKNQPTVRVDNRESAFRENLQEMSNTVSGEKEEEKWQNDLKVYPTRTLTRIHRRPTDRTKPRLTRVPLPPIYTERKEIPSLLCQVSEPLPIE